MYISIDAMVILTTPTGTLPHMEQQRKHQAYNHTHRHIFSLLMHTATITGVYLVGVRLCLVFWLLITLPDLSGAWQSFKNLRNCRGGTLLGIDKK